MGTIASQTTSLTIVYSTVYPGADQSKKTSKLRATGADQSKKTSKLRATGADQSKKTSKLRATGLCAGNSPETGECPAQLISNAENSSIWWRHHVGNVLHIDSIVSASRNKLFVSYAWLLHRYPSGVGFVCVKCQALAPPKWSTGFCQRRYSNY